MQKNKVFFNFNGFFALLCCFFVLACCALFLYLPKFRMGKNYTLYVQNSSSAQQISTQNPLVEKLTTPVRGESVVYDGNAYDVLVARFRARVLFCEQACGITNYYLYSPMLGECVYVNGYAVNLHIALREGSTAAGTPLIFGGY